MPRGVKPLSELCCEVLSSYITDLLVDNENLLLEIPRKITDELCYYIGTKDSRRIKYNLYCASMEHKCGSVLCSERCRYNLSPPGWLGYDGIICEKCSRLYCRELTGKEFIYCKECDHFYCKECDKFDKDIRLEIDEPGVVDACESCVESFADEQREHDPREYERVFW